MLGEAPFLGADAPQSGFYHGVSQLDGIERIFGFFRIPEYGVSLVVGETVASTLAPYDAHRNRCCSSPR